MRRQCLIYSLLSLLVMAALPAFGEPPRQSTVALINAAASDFLDDFSAEQAQQDREVSYELGSLDSRLSLAPCEQPLDVSFSGDPMRTTRATLLISCTGDRPWRIFLKAQVEIQAQGWVTSQPIGRGTRLDESMLEARMVTINEIRRAGYTNPENMIGMEARRNINAGTTITPDLLVAPDAVSRGDRVIIFSGNSAFAIETRGEAVNGGQLGDQITVINETSGRRVRGRIVAPGRVDINL